MAAAYYLVEYRDGKWRRIDNRTFTTLRRADEAAERANFFRPNVRDQVKIMSE